MSTFPSSFFAEAAGVLMGVTIPFGCFSFFVTFWSHCFFLKLWVVVQEKDFVGFRFITLFFMSPLITSELLDVARSTEKDQTEKRIRALRWCWWWDGLKPPNQLLNFFTDPITDRTTIPGRCGESTSSSFFISVRTCRGYFKLRSTCSTCSWCTIMCDVYSAVEWCWRHSWLLSNYARFTSLKLTLWVSYNSELHCLISTFRTKCKYCCNRQQNIHYLQNFSVF